LHAIGLHLGEEADKHALYNRLVAIAGESR
jgi:hypothetical protein